MFDPGAQGFSRQLLVCLNYHYCLHVHHLQFLWNLYHSFCQLYFLWGTSNRDSFFSLHYYYYYYSSSDRIYHYRANNDYSLNQSKRKSRIGRELKEEAVCVLAASKPGEFALFPAMKLDELCTENRFLCTEYSIVQSLVVER